MTFDGTCKTFALAGANYVDEIAACENISCQSLAYRIFRRICQTEFAKILNRSNACFVELTLNGFCQMFFFDFTIAELNGVVSVRINGLDTYNYVRGSFDDGYRDDCAFFSKDLSHT